MTKKRRFLNPTAKDILNLLAAKHCGDVFVPECKNGPTHTARHGELLRMDVWVMAKSWSRPLITVYEIKVRRSDYRQDTKWRGYLKYCNKFFFVCQYGLIQPSEVPEGVGLIWCSRQNKNLVTKKQAHLRYIKDPYDILRYILMARADIIAPNSSKKEKLRRWREWLNIKKGSYPRLGHEIKAFVSKRIDRLEEENISLLFKLTVREDLLEVLGLAGIDDPLVLADRLKVKLLT